MSEGICDLGLALHPWKPVTPQNRFSGFRAAEKTVEPAQPPRHRFTTPLKRSINEEGVFGIPLLFRASPRCNSGTGLAFLPQSQIANRNSKIP